MVSEPPTGAASSSPFIRPLPLSTMIDEPYISISVWLTSYGGSLGWIIAFFDSLYKKKNFQLYSECPCKVQLQSIFNSKDVYIFFNSFSKFTERVNVVYTVVQLYMMAVEQYASLLFSKI